MESGQSGLNRFLVVLLSTGIAREFANATAQLLDVEENLAKEILRTFLHAAVSFEQLDYLV